MFRRLFPKKIIPSLLAITGFMIHQHYYNQKYHCCGILGVISAKNRAQVIITEGIQLLQNRGYDSAGIVTRKPNEDTFQITKYSVEQEKKCIQKVVEQGKTKHKGSYIGIGHTRWATCGKISVKNAHPHHNETHKYFLVHNGTIVNYKEIKEKYLSGTKFESQTDTEVIIQLLAKICQQEKLTVAQGMSKIKDILIGQWGLVVLSDSQPQQMTIFTYGSPILVAFGEDQIYAASETIAFQNHTKQYFSTQNEQILTLSLSNANQLKQRMKDANRLVTINNAQRLKLKPSPAYRSFYEQQIQQQGHLVFKPYLKQLQGSHFSDNLTIIGCGSSYHAALYAQYYLKIFQTFKKVIVLDASEVLAQDISQNESLILVSQSGQTKDLLLALQMSKKISGVKTLCVVNVINSVLARQCDYRVFTNCGREVAVGATKSLTFQILNLLAIGVEIASQKGHSDSQKVQDARKQFPNINSMILKTIHQCQSKCKQVAQIVKNKQSLYILAKGDALPIAKQGALKIKQLTYIHTQALGASEMKHGPIALINCDKLGDTVVIILILNDRYLPVTKVTLDQMHSRKAFCVVITDCIDQLNKQKIGAYIQIPQINTFKSLLCLYPLQILANQICLLKGLDPDKPRNLAKTVTV